MAKKNKEKKLPFKQRMFNKILEKPINDILFITYEMYELSCKVYLDSYQIPSFEEYCQIVNARLKNLYYGGIEEC